jgi:hypothetical protein
MRWTSAGVSHAESASSDRHAAHGAVHHPIHVHFLDVAVEHELHDVFEDPQVLVAVFAGRGLAQEAADQHEGHERRRHEQNGKAGACSHRKDLWRCRTRQRRISHSRGLTGRPSIRSSK